MCSVETDENSNFIYVARNKQSFIKQETLAFVHNAIQQGDSLEQCIKEMRTSYGPCTFRSGIPESYVDMLRTLVATFHYKQTVNDFTAQGINFQHHVYVPEVDVITGEEFHERADHGHLLKRIAGKSGFQTYNQTYVVSKVGVGHLRAIVTD